MSAVLRFFKLWWFCGELLKEQKPLNVHIQNEQQITV